MFIIIIVFDSVLTRSSTVSSQDFYYLTQDQARDVTPLLGVSVIIQCYFVYVSSLLQLFLRLCSNRCADGLVVRRSSLLTWLASV